MRGDDEVTVLLLRVGEAGGVGFELVVAEALATGDDVPFFGVGWRAVGAVELIAPGEMPICWLGLRCGHGWKRAEHESEAGAGEDALRNRC